jgi:hypothetical protein
LSKGYHEIAVIRKLTIYRNDRVPTFFFVLEKNRLHEYIAWHLYYPGTQAVPINACPNVLNRPHSITGDVEIPSA